MAILPSGLETIDQGTQGWNAIFTDDIELIDDKLESVMTASKELGEGTVSDPAATTAETLTDSSGGSVTNTIGAVSGSGADIEINDNFASLVDEINKLRDDNVALRNKIQSLLDELRSSSGNGVLAG